MKNPDLSTEAKDHAEKGMDFADALHLGASVHCEAFLTFDRKHVRAAERAQVDVLGLQQREIVRYPAFRYWNCPVFADNDAEPQ